MNRYDLYKDSGVEWIGKIPNHWVISKLKYSTEITMGQSPNSDSYNDEGVGFPFLQGNSEFGISHPKHKLSTTQITKKSRIGDVLFSVRGSVGEINWSNIEYCIGRGLCSISPQELESKVLWYLLLFSKDEFLSNSVGSTFVSVTTDDVKNLQFPLPPLSEQQQIVSFLDTKTSLIDSLIEKTQRKIELLKEKRTSLINEVVTKGLNPNVEMKDSGVEWIGKIPSHWKRTPLKYNSYMKGRIGWKGLKQDEFLDKGNYYLITGHDIKNDKMNWENCYHISKERYEESPEIMLQEGDLLFTKDGTIGKTLYIESLPKPTSLNSHLLVIRPLNKFYDSKFLQYMFKTSQFLMYVEHNKTGTTFYGMSQNSMENFKGYFPPLSEQQQIVEYLDEQTQKIDNTISIEEKRIELLKEYRQSLISEVVTGKRKVIK